MIYHRRIYGFMGCTHSMLGKGIIDTHCMLCCERLSAPLMYFKAVAQSNIYTVLVIIEKNGAKSFRIILIIFVVIFMYGAI
jgi:hypothetical protein